MIMIFSADRQEYNLADRTTHRVLSGDSYSEEAQTELISKEICH